MKISKIQTNAGIFDRFKKKPQEKPTESEIPKSFGTPFGVVTPEVSEPPPLSEVTELKDNKEDLVGKFIGFNNWPEKLKEGVLTLEKLLNKSKKNQGIQRLTKAINELIGACVTHAIENTHLNFIPSDQIPEDMEDKIKEAIGNSVKVNEFIDTHSGKVIIKNEDDIVKVVATLYKSTFQAITLAILENDKVSAQIQNLLKSYRENFEDEKSSRQRAFENWQSAQKEQLREHQDSWKATSNYKSYSTVSINKIRKSLTERKAKFIDVIDRAIAAYDKGVLTLRSNPNTPYDKAFYELSMILETRFKTELDFGDRKEE